MRRQLVFLALTLCLLFGCGGYEAGTFLPESSEGLEETPLGLTALMEESDWEAVEEYFITKRRSIDSIMFKAVGQEGLLPGSLCLGEGNEVEGFSMDGEGFLLFSGGSTGNLTMDGETILVTRDGLEMTFRQI